MGQRSHWGKPHRIHLPVRRLRNEETQGRLQVREVGKTELLAEVFRPERQHRSELIGSRKSFVAERGM